MFTKVHYSFGARAILILILMIGVLGISPAKAVLADTLVVTNTNDSGSGSLRRAIANSVSGDTITFAPALAGQTITLSSSLPVISKVLTIDAGKQSIAIDGAGSYRIFEVTETGDLTINHLSIQNGKYSASCFDHATITCGSGIYSDGMLTIKNSTFSGNSAQSGGAVFLRSGTTTISNSTFRDNSATDVGGGILNWLGTLHVTNSTFYGNSAIYGGAIYNDLNSFTLSNSTFSGNSATQGAGLYNAGISLHFTNNILADSISGDDCYNEDGAGRISTNVNNLIEKNAASPNNCGIPALTNDPKLGSLANSGGPTQTMALLAGSPAIDAGADASCPATDQRRVPRPQGSHCDIGAYEAPIVTPFRSAGAVDGWVLESSENSNQGGITNPTAVTFILGDNAKNRQFRSILHFDTTSLPDNAIITSAVLKIKRQSVTGTNPFTTHKKIAVDIRKGAFSNDTALQPTDFQDVASKPSVGAFVNSPQPGGWYVAALTSTAHSYINLTGVTQLRLRFQTDDDNDAVADIIRFHSGDAVAAADRPVLVIEYYVP